MRVHSDIKSERLSLRLDSVTKCKLEQAAAVTQRSVNSFVIASALEKAEGVIQAHQAIVLSDRDRDLFLKAICKPRKFNAALKQALALHDRMIEQHGE